MTRPVCALYAVRAGDLDFVTPLGAAGHTGEDLSQLEELREQREVLRAACCNVIGKHVLTVQCSGSLVTAAHQLGVGRWALCAQRMHDAQRLL